MKAPYSVVLKCLDVPHVQSLRARTADDVTTFYRVFLNRMVVEEQNIHFRNVALMHSGGFKIGNVWGFQKI